MFAYIAFWLVFITIVVLCDVLWIIFFRRAVRKRKEDKLDMLLFKQEHWRY